MQFSCAQCKATLHLADDKVKGKKLVVRCKKCGNRITISDPALAHVRALGAAPAPAPPPAEACAVVSVEAPAHPAVLATDLVPDREADEDHSDTDATRAMDRTVLEEALRVSKADGPIDALAPQGHRASRPLRPVAAAPAFAPPEAAVSPSGDPAIWFAMVGGTQTGPLSRAELELKTTQGVTTARTYVWKDGMASWLRAKEVPELLALFATAAQPRVPKTNPPAPKGQDEGPLVPQVTSPPDGTPAPTSAVALANWASTELSTKGSVSAVVKTTAPPTADLEASQGAVQQPRPDALAGVPELPGLLPRDPVETTGNIIAKSGVHTSHKALYLGATGVVVAALLLLLWALSGGDDKARVSAPAEVARPSLGGSGNADVGGLAKREAASGADKAEKATALATKLGKKDPRADAALTSDEEAAMKGLDNERGIGNHGPKGDLAVAPTPEKGDSGLTAEDIKRKLGENRGALQRCIDEALRRQPNLKVGKIRIATTIAPSGQVTAAKIDKKPVDDSPLGGCLKKATRRIVFPSFSGEAFDVDIPIVVTAGE